MSEYQCLQFDAIDRNLTPSQRKAVSQLSSHIAVSTTSAEVTYHYGDFKHDPIEVLKQYFDLFTYQTNWGTQRLAFRFSKAVIDREALAGYETDGALDITEDDDNIIIDCYLDENWEDEYYDEEEYYSNAEPAGSPFASFYQEIIEGDYRALYIFWLKAAKPTSTAATPIPDDLAKLEEEHLILTRFIGLDQDLLFAAQSLSKPKSEKSRQGFQPENSLRLLSNQEAKKHLENLLKQNPSSAKSELVADLRKKANQKSPSETRPKDTVRIADLAEQARSIKDERERLAKEESQKQAQRYFAKLKRERSRMWAKAPEFIERKKPKYYEYAILILHALKQLAKREHKLDEYYRKANAIADRYPTLVALQRRLEVAKVISRNELSDTPYHSLLRERWTKENPPEKEFPFHLLSE